MIKRVLTFAVLSLTSLSAIALTYSLPYNGDSVIGDIQYIHTTPDQRLADISREYEMGFYEMIEANPGINRHSPISTQDTVVIPSEFVLPDVPHEGIVINLPELRLYYFPQGSDVVRTEPIAIGRYDWMTPTLTTKVIEKEENPSWYVPKSIQEASARKGIHLPDVVKAGPKNPLGTHALRLGDRSYLIHGTNNPSSIGKRESSGCMRMYPEDIATLFEQVPVGTPVRIINDFYKLGWLNGVLYLEIHEPLQETAEPAHEQIRQINEGIEKITQGKPIHIDWNIVNKAIEDQNGIPVAISTQVNYTTHSSDEPTNTSGKDTYYTTY